MHRCVTSMFEAHIYLKISKFNVHHIISYDTLRVKLIPNYSIIFKFTLFYKEKLMY